MAVSKKSTKTRLLEAALDLFAEKGVTETTTKAVAERAGVNEVTLFRYFGNKSGLLFAVMEEARVFTRLGRTLVEQAGSTASISETLENYSRVSLQALDRAQKLVHSVVGEAHRYPLENRLTLGQGLMQMNQYVARYLEEGIVKEGLQSNFPPEKLASLLHEMLLGYFILQSASADAVWEGQEDFLESLGVLFSKGAIFSSPETAAVFETQRFSVTENRAADLPAHLVRSLFQRAKKLGRQPYALVYILFGAGLSVEEIVHLERSHSIGEPQQHLLQINSGAVRQVPLNQWIMGKRYGSPSNNPLTQWLKHRKDDRSALLINQQEQPMSRTEILNLWQAIAGELLTPQGRSPAIKQAQHTWCVDMLLKGIEVETLSLLSGMTVEELQPFARRAKEKAAIEAAQRLDRKIE